MGPGERAELERQEALLVAEQMRAIVATPARGSPGVAAGSPFPTPPQPVFTPSPQRRLGRSRPPERPAGVRSSPLPPHPTHSYLTSGGPPSPQPSDPLPPPTTVAIELDPRSARTPVAVGPSATARTPGRTPRTVAKFGAAFGPLPESPVEEEEEEERVVVETKTVVVEQRAVKTRDEATGTAKVIEVPTASSDTQTEPGPSAPQQQKTGMSEQVRLLREDLLRARRGVSEVLAGLAEPAVRDRPAAPVTPSRPRARPQPKQGRPRRGCLVQLLPGNVDDDEEEEVVIEVVVGGKELAVAGVQVGPFTRVFPADKPDALSGTLGGATVTDPVLKDGRDALVILAGPHGSVATSALAITIARSLVSAGAGGAHLTCAAVDVASGTVKDCLAVHSEWAEPASALQEVPVATEAELDQAVALLKARADATSARGLMLLSVVGPEGVSGRLTVISANAEAEGMVSIPAPIVALLRGGAGAGTGLQRKQKVVEGILRDLHQDWNVMDIIMALLVKTNADPSSAVATLKAAAIE